MKNISLLILLCFFDGIYAQNYNYYQLENDTISELNPDWPELSLGCTGLSLKFIESTNAGMVFCIDSISCCYEDSCIMFFSVKLSENEFYTFDKIGVTSGLCLIPNGVKYVFIACGRGLEGFKVSSKKLKPLR